MPDKDEKEIQHKGQYDDESEEPGYDMPPIKVPKDVPQEHLSSPMPSSPVEKAPKSEIFKRLFYLLLAIPAIAIVGIAAWKLIPDQKDDQAAPAQTAGQTPGETEPADPIALALGNSDLTETYQSEFLLLSMKHPASWKVSEKDNYIIVKSPEFDLQDNSGVESKSYFKIYIKRGTDAGDGKYLGKGYAVAPSEKISYSDPAESQRKETFLTDFGLESPDNFGYFVIQGTFNLKKGDTLGPNFANEPEAFLLAGGFASDQQRGNLETRPAPLDSYKDNLAYVTAVEIIKSVQLR
ncbi:MAG TPA: hypothetical protein VFX86_02575 [Candidatus Saccharimonadales bacterium]|nr:hypothetical protein [Candidatus Saccharimonadales bacterium]